MIEVAVREDADSGRVKQKLVQRARVIFREDSAAVDAVISQNIETRVFGTERGAIPYLNMSFALLEQAVRRTRAPGATADAVPFFNLGGGQTVSAQGLAAGRHRLARAGHREAWSTVSRWIGRAGCSAERSPPERVRRSGAI